jgi:S1-C subfamily serine protease
VEEDWRAWVLEQDTPWRPGWEAVAHLGIRMQQEPHGVRVDAFVPGASAARSRQLQVGDVILSIAGRPTPTPDALRDAVRACRPGQTVLIEVVRDGRTTTVSQILGAVRHAQPAATTPPAAEDPDPTPQP